MNLSVLAKTIEALSGIDPTKLFVHCFPIFDVKLKGLSHMEKMYQL